MNREESIALVNELCSECRTVRGFQKEIDDNENLLRELNDTKFVPKRLFPFFRRYLIIGVITLVAMLIPTLMFSGVIFFISFESNLKPVYPMTAIAFLFLINIENRVGRRSGEGMSLTGRMWRKLNITKSAWMN